MLSVILDQVRTLLSTQAAKAWVAGIISGLLTKFIPDAPGFDEAAWINGLVVGAVTLLATFLVPNAKAKP